jgi:hypothetical protein
MYIVIERASVLLGFLTLGTILAIFASCSSCFALLGRLGLKKLTSSRIYQNFFHYHLLYWNIFGILLLTHLSMAIGHTGIPQSSDPDAPIHRTILLLGLGAVLLAAIILLSCRVSRKFFLRSSEPGSITRKTYQSLNSFHGYYWWAVFAFIGIHFFVAHMHVGFWPVPSM